MVVIGFGYQVEVIKPKRHRDEFIEIGNGLVNSRQVQLSKQLKKEV